MSTTEVVMPATSWIIERVGWSQWLDEGDVWRASREAARRYTSRDAAEAAAAALTTEPEGDTIPCRVVPA